jgi:pimeloyl-ACP methyl ester carboxylesterase
MPDWHRDLFVSAADGLRLYALEAGPLVGDALPVVCLPGLARTSADFEPLAAALAQHAERPRRVLALDYRGRGRSEWDRDFRRYDLRVELDDVLQVLTAAGVHEAVFVGTSRGGLITMGLGAIRPALVRGAVLNDIGPVIEGKGLVRIRSYVGRLPVPRSYAEGAEILKRLSDAQFPDFGDEQWDGMARGTWRETEAGLVLAYDPQLMRTLDAVDVEAPIPPLWFLFAGLRRVRVLALRGAHSDVLSARTLAAMAEAHPRLEAVTVPGQGHAPLIAGSLADRIVRFVEVVEAEGAPAAMLPQASHEKAPVFPPGLPA